jgi:predicted dehydrogenase
MAPLDRRDFLRNSAALAIALAGTDFSDDACSGAAADKQPTKRGSAIDRLHVALLGVGFGALDIPGQGRGMDHIHGIAGKHNCIITTICDVDTRAAGPALKAAAKAQGVTPRFEQDLRRIMDDKSIDIVCIAMPNHWHALASIWAMQSGKDVYVEKPVSHNICEGRRIIEAARKYNRICQTGTQSRSMPGMRAAMDFLHSGELGKVQIARGLCYKPRGSIGKVKGPQPIHSTVDFNLWCGPAPIKPLMRKNLHYDWHWIWDYGNGDLGNQGIHEMDKARWGLGKQVLPRLVMSLGGRFGYVDDGETANTQVCIYDYGDSKLIFEVRGLKTDPLRAVRVGNIFHCENGLLVVPSYSAAVALDKDGKVIRRFKGEGDHFGNWVKAVRNRQVSDLHADIADGHLSSALCHLGNISYRLGTMQPFTKERKTFGEDKDAYEAFARMEEHLRENKVPIEATQYRVGRHLSVEPHAERFVNDSEANAYLTREYRAPFIVPDKI